MTKKNSLLPFIISFACLSQAVHAGCNRDDVEFYLSKGFSTDQITTLCDSTKINKNNSDRTTSDSPIKQTQASESPDIENKQLFLREAIKGRNVLLTDNTLTYTLRVCITYGEEDMFGFAAKACPDIRFSVNLAGLNVQQPEKKSLFSPDSIEIEGRITRSIIDGLEKFKPEEQKLISSLIETGNTTRIPVRDDISIDKLYRVLEELTR